MKFRQWFQMSSRSARYRDDVDAEVSWRQRFDWVVEGVLFGLRYLLSLGVCYLLIVFLHAFWSRPVRQITVTGQVSELNPVQLKKLLQEMSAQQSWLHASLEPMQQRLRQLPWVKKVQVQRVWPANFVVRIVQHQPVARLPMQSLLAADGSVIPVSSTAHWRALPLLAVPVDQLAVAQGYLPRFAQWLSRMHHQLQRVQWSSQSGWTLTCRDGLVIHLGREDMLMRLQHLVWAYPSLLRAQGVLKMIDARYSDGVAVK